MSLCAHHWILVCPELSGPAAGGYWLQQVNAGVHGLSFGGTELYNNTNDDGTRLITDVTALIRSPPRVPSSLVVGHSVSNAGHQPSTTDFKQSVAACAVRTSEGSVAALCYPTGPDKLTLAFLALHHARSACDHRIARMLT